MKILAIDYGEKRIGLALSDGKWIRPLEVLEVFSLDLAIEEITKIISQYQIKKIIIGMPQPFRGGENERTLATKSFAQKLTQRASLLIEFSSEIFTSKLASVTAHTKKQQKNIDSRSACLILENHLVAKKRPNKC